MKNICKKTITFSIILLLIGVSVSSAISVDTISTISNNEIVEDCGCEEVSDTDLIKVERLLNRFEKITFKTFLRQKICDFIGGIIDAWINAPIVYYIWKLQKQYPPDSFMYGLFTFILYIYELPTLPLLGLWVLLYCDELDIPIPSPLL